MYVLLHLKHLILTFSRSLMIIKLLSTSFVLIILYTRQIRMLYLLDIVFWHYGYKIFEHEFCTGTPKIVQSELSILLDMTFRLDIFFLSKSTKLILACFYDQMNIIFIHSILSGFFFTEYNQTVI